MSTYTWNGQTVEIVCPSTHVVSRTKRPEEYPKRLYVPDHMVPWSVDCPGYMEKRTDYTAPKVLANFPSGWAQAPDPEDVPAGEIRSYYPLRYSREGYPLNPVGRTGFGPGRGLLGRWGANFAADPLVTWEDKGETFALLILRGDGGGWAIPGGMADKGESLGSTLRRELGEETSVKLSMEGGKLIYVGYADDWRNSDHAWMETIVVHRRVSKRLAKSWRLKAGDDAAKVVPMRLTPQFIDGMYASHGAFIKMALPKLART